LRYRTHVRVLHGSRIKHDIVFSRARVVVEIRGCFWHSCPLHGTVPASNRDWSIEKLGQNVARDERVERELATDGWRLLTVWEHDDMDEAADRIELAVRSAAPLDRLGESR
jgi:DNA mismatch endonuclease Vsr